MPPPALCVLHALLIDGMPWGAHSFGVTLGFNPLQKPLLVCAQKVLHLLLVSVCPLVTPARATVLYTHTAVAPVMSFIA